MWNETTLIYLQSTNWRAILVPAAAVIPAPIVYANIVAVKKLVVEFLRESTVCVRFELQILLIPLTFRYFSDGIWFLAMNLVYIYFEKISVF